MTVRMILATAVAAVITVTSAAAAGALNDPKTLVLQKSDFPAGAKAGQAFVVNGIVGAKGKAYTSNFFFWVGSPNQGGDEEVTSKVDVWSSAGDAAKDYKITLATYTGFGGVTVFRLPAYGDEQYADYNPKTATGQVIVRKNGVVWRLTVDNVVGSSRRKLTKTQALSELKKYALKEKRRVGSG